MSPGVAAFVVATMVGVVWMALLARAATTPVAHAAAACDGYEARADAQRAIDTREPDGDGICCGGQSPRIVTAEVVGSRGVAETEGATLRAKLGLTDAWAGFVSISGASAGVRARPSSFAFRSVGTLRGTVIGRAAWERAGVQSGAAEPGASWSRARGPRRRVAVRGRRARDLRCRDRRRGGPAVRIG